MTRVQAGKLEELKKGFQGEVILPGDRAYDDARTIRNASINRYPAVIVQAVNAISHAGVKKINFGVPQK